jgi:ABC-type uncharacterized transport system permease subunit
VILLLLFTYRYFLPTAIIQTAPIDGFFRRHIPEWTLLFTVIGAAAAVMALFHR